jgi:hypothetical protein
MSHALICEMAPDIVAWAARFGGQQTPPLSQEEIADLRAEMAQDLLDSFFEEAPNGTDRIFSLRPKRYAAGMPAFAHNLDAMKGDSGAGIIRNPDGCVQGVYTWGPKDEGMHARPTWMAHQVGVDIKDLLDALRADGQSDLLTALGVKPPG